MSNIRVGISGWRYTPWRGVFYPEGLRQKDELKYASEHLRTIEINGTFYALQRPSSFQEWHDTIPHDFVFSVKAPRYITHIRRLRDVQDPLANFFASGVLCLGKKLGPVLWQFPPNFKFDQELIEEFFSMLPRTSKKAAQLAKKHDPHMKGRAWTNATASTRIRHAMEVRHDSFKCPEFISLLRKHNVALVIADSAGHFPYMEDITADFIYLRLHGKGKIYAGGYGETSIQQWAKKIRTWSKGSEPRDAQRVAKPAGKSAPRDIFVYFDNDIKVKAPRDAMRLAEILNVSPSPQKRRSSEIDTMRRRRGKTEEENIMLMDNNRRKRLWGRTKD